MHNFTRDHNTMISHSYGKRMKWKLLRNNVSENVCDTNRSVYMSTMIMLKNHALCKSVHMVTNIVKSTTFDMFVDQLGKPLSQTR